MLASLSISPHSLVNSPIRESISDRWLKIPLNFSSAKFHTASVSFIFTRPKDRLSPKVFPPKSIWKRSLRASSRALVSKPNPYFGAFLCPRIQSLRSSRWQRKQERAKFSSQRIKPEDRLPLPLASLRFSLYIGPISLCSFSSLLSNNSFTKPT